MLSGRTKLVGIIGNPVAHLRSPAMHNAGFAARGLDWAYVPLLVEDGRVEDAVRGLAALGFAGANVTTPHKAAAAAASDTELESVNVLVVRDGRVEGLSTDAAILDGLQPKQPVILGSGGAAAAFRVAMPSARVFSRRGDWPPDFRGADLVVNATSEREDVLCTMAAGQTLIDLPYPETGTAQAALAAGATVISGLEVLVAQGIAAFELWTGMAAPVEAMRAAVGLRP